MQQKVLILTCGAVGVCMGFVLGRRADVLFSRAPRPRMILRSRAESGLLHTLATYNSYFFKGWPGAGVNEAAKQRFLLRAAEYVTAAGPALEAERLAVLVPPNAAARPKQIEAHGDVRTDDYYWLRDDERKDPAVLRHLDEENTYISTVLADTEGLQDALYKEMRGRIQEADQSVPQRFSGWYYYTRTMEGAQYKVHCRRKVPAGTPPQSEAEVMDDSVAEEVLLDENEEAKKHPFYMVAGFETSPNHRLLAWTEDTVGGEKFTLRVKDLTTGKEVLSKPIKDTSGNFVWANDNQTLFYVTKDSLDRPYKVWRHKVGSDPATDVCVFLESDEAFYVGVHRSRSEKLLFISSGSAVTSEERFIPADDPLATWQVLLPRTQDVEYEAKHRGDHLLMLIRDKERFNSELLVAPLDNPSKTTALLRHRPNVKIESFALSKDYLALFERQNGLQVCVVYKLPIDGSAPTSLEGGTTLAFDDPAYELGPGSQGDFDSPVLRLGYSSLSKPESVLDHNMDTGKRVTKKVQPVLGGFEASKYTTERLWATAPDGVKVPISLVYRNDLFKQDGQSPLLLYGYGSYEVCIDPYFSSTRLSLLDRGWAFAIAHIRGGGEMGRKWYEDGKFLHKKNTFTDFIACAEYMVAEKYTSPAKLSINGRSAGGLLMGAVTNMRPDLFNAVVAGVPFVDCLTTMLDPTIPLTVIEEEEWGAPSSSKEYYEYIKSYSPVDNVIAQAYPHIMVTGGLHDPRVGYWEPAKWVAKVRRLRTDSSKMLLFKCEMGAGHFSESGRFDKLKTTALEYAFLLKTQGMVNEKPQ